MLLKIRIFCAVLFFLPLFAIGQGYDNFIGSEKSQINTSTPMMQSDSVSTAGADSVLQASEELRQLLKAALDESEKATEQEIGLEIDGLIVDETRTKAGQDFYDHFYSNWEAPPNARNFSVKIKEEPFRLRTTQVIVKINDNEVFQAMLQPRKDYIEAVADYAISRSQQFLANYEEIMEQLGGEDQLGTGIY